MNEYDFVCVYLSRQNLEHLLNELDKKEKLPTIRKHKECSDKFKQSHDTIHIVAVENDEYYNGRVPGIVQTKIDKL